MDNGSLAGKINLKTKLGQHDYTKKTCDKCCPLYNTDNCIIKGGGDYSSCWGDKSGFQYDLIPRNTIGPGGVLQSLYDLNKKQISHNYLKLSQWNAWIEKFQCDYRFGQVSDVNAEGILFPNVDNPWMFTEYVFRGVGGDSSKIAWTVPEQYVIQPPIYDPQTLKLVNGDLQLNTVEDYSGKYKQVLGIDQNKDSSSSSSKALSAEDLKVKRFRKIQSWDAIFNISEEQRKKIELDKEENEGVKLYRARIPVQSIKWGEHGNIPPHTIDMTAPKKWFNPSEAVSRIKVVYDAVVGAPLYGPSGVVGIVQWCTNGCDCYIVDVSSLTLTTVYSNGVREEEGEEQDDEVDEGQSSTSEDGSSSSELEATNVFWYEYSAGEPISSLYDFQNAGSDFQVIFVDTPKLRLQNTSRPRSMQPTAKLMGYPGREYFYHTGCIFLKSDSSTIHCSKLESMSENDPNISIFSQVFIPCNCGQGNEQCPFYTQGDTAKVIATYQEQLDAVVTQQTMLQSALAGASLLDALKDPNQFYNNHLYNTSLKAPRQEVQVTYVPRYVVEQAAENSVQLNKIKYNEFGKDVQLIPNTGKFAVQERTHFPSVMRGDSPLYNDISTLSFHRFFASVMHCASQKSCNGIVGPGSQSSGFSLDSRAGEDGNCNYYNNNKSLDNLNGCPYNCVSKRAYQFANVMKLVESSLDTMIKTYIQATRLGAWGTTFNANDVFPDTVGMFKKKTIKSTEWIVFKKFAVMKKSQEIAVFAYNVTDYDFGQGEGGVQVSAVSQNYSFVAALGGACLLKDDSAPNGYALCAQIKTSSADYSVYYDDTQHTYKAYFCVDKYFWYQPVTNNGKTLKQLGHDPVFSSEVTPSTIEKSNKILPALRQTVDSNGFWFCKIQSTYFTPKSNCMMVDNEQKFIGGWHPEYKNYASRGSEFLQKIQDDASREGAGIGDNVSGAGYSPIPQAVNQKGYWIDQSGEYVIDEAKIGIDRTIAREPERENMSLSGAVCISFKKSNTTFSGETGESKQPKTINAAVYSNDSITVIKYYRENGKPQFQEPDSDNKYRAPCFVRDENMLPTARAAIHCPKCDYYLSQKYLSIKTCPWCDTQMVKIKGSKAGPGQGEMWSENSSVIKKFFKLGSIGMVDVWDIPGSSIKTDAYFWRHQAPVTNAIRRQIYHKLGKVNTGGGGYQASNNTPKSQQTGGYPQGTGYFQKYDKNKKLLGSNNSSSSSESAIYDTCMINYHMTDNPLPNLDRIKNEAQNFINPYSNSGVNQQGLKMLSLQEIITLRNKIQPIFAYTSSETSTDYNTLRASYNLRQSATQPIIWTNKKARVPIQVLAMTDDGTDSYQEYFSGDYTYGNVRQFFPSGYTWWYMHNTLGGRLTSNSGGRFHMDDGGKEGGGYMPGGSGGTYTTGTKTIAKCALSIYGLVPLNKEILKAYIVISPSSLDPSRDPVGKPWVARKGDGGTMYCHYHALKQDHYEDGVHKHLHGRAGFPEDTFFDENGNMTILTNNGGSNSGTGGVQLDQSDHALYGTFNDKMDDDRFIYYEDNFIEEMNNMSAVYDIEFYRNVGTPKKELESLNKDDKNLYLGYDRYSFPSPYGFQITDNYSLTEDKRNKMFQYLMLNEDSDLVIKYPTSQVWKQVTKSELEKEIERHTAEIEFGVSDGKEQNYTSVVFTQVDDALYGNLVTQQSQGISGYFDMTWTNTKGYVYDYYKVASNQKVAWDAPVIFQSDDANTKASTSASVDVQMGMATRVVQVTDVVKRLYNDRIDRQFVCKAGLPYSEIVKWEFYQPIPQPGSKLDQDVKNQNKQIFPGSKSQGYILNDAFSYPKVEEDFSLLEVDGQGNKYEMSPNTSEVNIVISEMFVTINEKNCAYKIKIGDETNEGKLPSGQIVVKGTTTSNGQSAPTGFKEVIAKMFPNTTIIEISTLIYKVQSSKEITIYQVDNSCYEFFGLKSSNASTTFPVVQHGRILSDANSSSLFDYPANSLLYSDDKQGRHYWKFKTFSYRQQSIVFDLARAPLLKSQRPWRNQQSYTDYSNCHCTNDACQYKSIDASFMHIANNKNVYFDKYSNTCPQCKEETKDTKRVIQHPGDGIKTYFYDAPFAPCAFIKRIKFKLDNEKSDFVISVRSQYADDWYTIAFGRSGKQICVCKNNVWTEVAKSYTKDVDIVFGDADIRGRFVQINVGVKQNYQFKQLAIVYHMKKIKVNDKELTVKSSEGSGFRGYYLSCYGDNDYNAMTQDCMQEVYAIIGKQETTIPTKQEFDAAISSVYTSLQGSSSSSATSTSSGAGAMSTKYGDAVRITSAVKGDGKWLFSMDRNYPDAALGEKALQGGTAYLKFYLRSYTGGISDLQIIGTHYKTEASEDAEGTKGVGSGQKYLTITDMPDEYKMMFREQTYEYSLPFRPTKIYSVLVGNDTTGGYPLTESTSNNNLEWKLNQQELTDGSNKYNIQKIVGGSYYYDAKTAKIYIPEYGKVNGQNISISQLEKSINNTQIYTSYLPTFIKIKYFTGNGKTVTLQAQATAQGPSFMVEKGAINTISTPMSNIEYSGKIIDCDGKQVNKKPITWQVSNNAPATLNVQRMSRSYTAIGADATTQYTAGQFRKSFAPDALVHSPGGGTDEDFVNLYGNHCEGCIGLCTTQVTFTGAPNKILSGNITIKAPKETKRTINVGGGKSYTYTQKTGGINQGLLIVRCTPSGDSGGRMTKCYNIPEIIIYAKDVDPYSS